ncbi:hypothetical protein CsSME_00030309 [Camellia sinensis var. sinensis]
MKKGNGNGSVLQFAPFQSAVDERFWHRLSSLKLNLFGSDDSPLSITGIYLYLCFFISSPNLIFFLFFF